MLDKIARILEFKCKMHANDHLVLGVSGGPDSLCLLHVLNRLGYSLTAVHINHQLRTEADAEEQIVKSFAENLGVVFISDKVDVQQYREANSVSIEEAARSLRYQSLFKYAKENNVDAVAVGHNADDQVETILMHLLRGSGLSGLTGMEFRSLSNPWSQTIPLIRPLLSTTRLEIQQYNDENGLIPTLDSSNLDVSFFRNRLRHELIPVLESYNPSIGDILLRMGENLRDDYVLLQHITNQAWESLRIEQGNGYLAFQVDGFVELHPSIQRYLLRKAVAVHLPGLVDVGFECIERGRELLMGETPGTRTDLIRGIRLIKEGKRFWVATWQADLPSDSFPVIHRGKEIAVAIPSKIELGNGWSFVVKKISPKNQPKTMGENEAEPFQAWMDVTGLEEPLIIRGRKPGDVIKPLGLNGHSVKLSDLMINAKIPSRVRDTWPLVVSGDEIVWVPGYRISQRVRIDSNSREAIHLFLHRD